MFIEKRNVDIEIGDIIITHKCDYRVVDLVKKIDQFNWKEIINIIVVENNNSEDKEHKLSDMEEIIDVIRIKEDESKVD